MYFTVLQGERENFNESDGDRYYHWVWGIKPCLEITVYIIFWYVKTFALHCIVSIDELWYLFVLALVEYAFVCLVFMVCIFGLSVLFICKVLCTVLYYQVQVLCA